MKEKNAWNTFSQKWRLPSDLIDATGVLFHGNLLHRALETKERLDVQTGGLLEARPLLVLWVNLRNQHTRALFTYCKAQ